MLDAFDCMLDAFDCMLDAFDLMLHAQVLAAQASTSSGVLPLEGQHVLQRCKVQNLGFLEGTP